MSGIVNTTGAVSGVIGTTVGTFDLATATFPAGHVLQTVSSTYTGIASGTGVTPTLPNAACAVAITPSDSLNKILITIHSSLAATENTFATLHIFKGSSEISGARNSVTSAADITLCAISSGYMADLAGQNRDTHAVSTQYMDTAGSSGSPITYGYRIRARDTLSWYVNQTRTGSVNNDANQATISTITVQEIKV